MAFRAWRGPRYARSNGHKGVTRVKGPINHTLRSLQRNILAGIITIGPLFVTYLIFSYVLESLAKAGLPAVQFLAATFPRGWFGTSMAAARARRPAHAGRPLRGWARDFARRRTPVVRSL